MSSIRIDLLRNKPVAVLRNNEQDKIWVHGPTVGELYNDSNLFIITQVLTSDKEELKKMLSVDINVEREEMIRLLLTNSAFSEELAIALKVLIPKITIEEEFILYENKEVSELEFKRIEDLLKIIIGQDDFEKQEEEKEELSPAALRMKEIEARLEKKKENKSKKEASKYPFEDVLIALTYEFNFTIEQMMDMNYFTLLWYYSYIGKIHGYRLTTAALGAGVGKDFDYFTNIK